MRLVVVLLAAAVLVGPASVPASAAESPAAVAAPVAAAATGTDEWPDEVRDRFHIPVSNYRILAPRDNLLGVPTNWETTVVVLFASGLFVAARTGVTMGIWTLTMALDFTLADLLLSPVQEIIDIYQNGYVGTLTGGGWGLIPLALMFCVFWFGLAALRGRVGRGAGEITLSFVLAVVLGAVLAKPALVLGNDGLYGRAKDIGVDVAVAALRPADGQPVPVCPPSAALGGRAMVDGCMAGDDGFPAGEPVEADPQYLRWVMQQWLVDLYVRQPHQRMTYGQRLDCPLALAVRVAGEPDGEHPCEGDYADGGRHPCVDVYNQILATTPETADTTLEWHIHPSPVFLRPRQSAPENYMRDMMRRGGADSESGCDEGDALAAYLSNPNVDRVIVGFMLLLAVAALLAFLLLGVVVPIIAGQVMLALLVVALLVVLPVALLGGGSRRILWRWFGLLLASVFMIIMALVGLSLMLITTGLLLQGTYRFFMISLVLASLSSLLFLFVQRRLLRGAMAGGRAVGLALAGVRFGARTGGVSALAGAAGGAGAALGPAGGGDAWTRAATAGVAPVMLAARAGRAGISKAGKAMATGAGVLAAGGAKQGIAWAVGTVPAVQRRRARRAYGHHDRKQRIRHAWEADHWEYALARDQSWMQRYYWANYWQQRRWPSAPPPAM